MKTKIECEKMRRMGLEALAEGRSWPVIVQQHVEKCAECSSHLAWCNRRLEGLAGVVVKVSAVEPAVSFRACVMERVRREQERQSRVREVFSVERTRAEFEALIRGESANFQRGLVVSLILPVLSLLMLIPWGLTVGPLRLLDFARTWAQWCTALPIEMTGVALVVALVLAWGGKWLGERLAEKVGSKA